MQLTSALLKSMQGIALRRGVRPGQPKTVFEFLFAVESVKDIFLLNGRTGAIRRTELADHAREDWEPFQPLPEMRRGRRRLQSRARKQGKS